MTKLKIFGRALLIMAAVLFVAVFASADVSAFSSYTGYNSVGSYMQYGWQSGGIYAGNYNTFRAPGGPMQINTPRMWYPTTPRAGGWFGGGTGWLTGLRAPYYGCVAPSHYSTAYRPSCGSFYGYSGYQNAVYGGYGGYQITRTGSMTFY